MTETWWTWNDVMAKWGKSWACMNITALLVAVFIVKGLQLKVLFPTQLKLPLHVRQVLSVETEPYFSNDMGASNADLQINKLVNTEEVNKISVGHPSCLSYEIN